MVIEVNKDIDRYQESVAMGLTARQLIFSIASVVVGGGIVLLLYKYIGLTGSAYVAIPCVAPIALGGFFSFYGVSFLKYMGKNLFFFLENGFSFLFSGGSIDFKWSGKEGKGKKKKKQPNKNRREKEQEELGKKEKKKNGGGGGVGGGGGWVNTCIKTDSLNEGKSLSKNGSPVTFLIEKSDYDYSLLFLHQSYKRQGNY